MLGWPNNCVQRCAKSAHPLTQGVICLISTMETIINKSKKSVSAVTFFRSISMFGCLFGVFYSVFSLLVAERISHSFFLGVVVSIISVYFYNRFIVIQSINDEKVVLEWKSKSVTVPITDIKSISKNFRFTFTENFLWILKIKGSRFNLLNLYIFPNEKEYDLKTVFKNSGIPLKNIP